MIDLGNKAKMEGVERHRTHNGVSHKVSRCLSSDRFRQPDNLPAGFKKEGLERLTALRPRLTAGLPLSVQSLTLKDQCALINAVVV